MVVSGLQLPFLPTDAFGVTESGASGQIIWATADTTTLSRAGCKFNLSAPSDDSNQTLVITFYGYSTTVKIVEVPSIALYPFNWTPESGNPLTSPAISGAAFENTLMNNLAEFLSGYFTGGTHYVFGNQMTLFQRIAIRFQQGQTPQPLEGAYIRTVLSNSGSGVQEQYSGYWRTRQVVGIEFWIHASLKRPRPDGWNSDFLCRNVSDCLYALLLDRGTSIPLQKNGFRKIRPTNPSVVYDPLYSTRRIRCSMNVWFDTPASGAVDSTLGGDN